MQGRLHPLCSSACARQRREMRSVLERGEGTRTIDAGMSSAWLEEDTGRQAVEISLHAIDAPGFERFLRGELAKVAARGT